MEKCTRDCPVHPGKILKGEIEYHGLSQSEIATQMGISCKLLNRILNERRSLTAEIAIRFEAVLGVPADMLIDMQMDYDSQRYLN
jgi:addiction module HigA family antidote